MRIPITLTYTVGALVVAATVLMSALWATRTYFERDFTQYLFENEREELTVMAAEAAARYEIEGSWLFLDADRKTRHEFGKSLRSRHFQLSQEANDSNTGPLLRQNRNGRSHRPSRRSRVELVDAERNLVFGRDNPDDETGSARIEEPVVVNGNTVGYLQNRTVERFSRDIDLAFSNSHHKVMLWVGLLGMILASVFAFLFARRLVAPIKSIQQHTRLLQQGQFEQSLLIDRNDELSDLAKGLNDLGTTLAANKTARKRWLADISHELRTPLAVIKGEIEALQDGIRPLNADALHSLAGEVDHLQYLINDLNELTLSDLGALNYEKTPLNLKPLITDLAQQVQAQFAKDAVLIRYEKIDDNAWVMGDSHRLRQLFSNLLENAIKYSDRPAQIEIHCQVIANDVVCFVYDSPPGIKPNERDKIFEPLYRADQSRTGRSSGLGLAICRNLATAHHATISAQSSPLGGLGVKIVFPRVEKS